MFAEPKFGAKNVPRTGGGGVQASEWQQLALGTEMLRPARHASRATAALLLLASTPHAHGSTPGDGGGVGAPPQWELVETGALPVIGQKHPDVVKHTILSGFETGQFQRINDTYYLTANELGMCGGVVRPRPLPRVGPA